MRISLYRRSQSREPFSSRTVAGIRVTNPGRVLYEENAHKWMQPASNMKLYTVAAALDRFGPDYRFVTSVYAPARPDRAGTIKGDLTVYGRGDPTYATRFNPEGDAEMNARQTKRLKRLGDWLHENDRKYLFELLVPAEDHQLEKVDGHTDRYDAELRPELMRRAIEDIQNYGIEVDIWKIEGIDTQEDCQRIADTCRRDGRDGVICVVLGRGANDEKVDHWLRQGAPVDGYAGFAIGRTIWWDALKGFLDGSLERFLDRPHNRIDRAQLRLADRDWTHPQTGASGSLPARPGFTRTS